VGDDIAANFSAFGRISLAETDFCWKNRNPDYCSKLPADTAVSTTSVSLLQVASRYPGAELATDTSHDLIVYMV